VAIIYDNLLTEDQLSKVLTIAPATLRGWRSRGCGPAYFKLAGQSRGTSRVRYRMQDVEEWLEQCRVEPAKAELVEPDEDVIEKYRFDGELEEPDFIEVK